MNWFRSPSQLKHFEFSIWHRIQYRIVEWMKRRRLWRLVFMKSTGAYERWTMETRHSFTAFTFYRQRLWVAVADPFSFCFHLLLTSCDLRRLLTAFRSILHCVNIEQRNGTNKPAVTWAMPWGKKWKFSSVQWCLRCAVYADEFLCNDRCSDNRPPIAANMCSHNFQFECLDHDQPFTVHSSHSNSGNSIERSNVTMSNAWILLHVGMPQQHKMQRTTEHPYEVHTYPLHGRAWTFRFASEICE